MMYTPTYATDTLYVDEDGDWSHSPDGIGRVWHESKEHAIQETGLTKTAYAHSNL